MFFFCVFYDGFLAGTRRVKLKINTSGLNPWFWVQNHRFGLDVATSGPNQPDVFILKCSWKGFIPKVTPSITTTTQHYYC